MTDLHVFDPAFSLGVNDSDVQFKYLSPTDGWKANSLTRFSGDFVSGIGSDWDAHYSGTIDLDDVYDGDIIEVQARVDDISGSTSWVHTSSSYYTLMGTDCP